MFFTCKITKHTKSCLSFYQHKVLNIDNVTNNTSLGVGDVRSAPRLHDNLNLDNSASDKSNSKIF